MKRFWLAAAAAFLFSLFCAAAPARAEQQVVLLIPAHVFNGNRENGPRVTEALRDNLEHRGFKVIAAERTRRVLDDRNIDLSSRLTLDVLADLRHAADADFVVYPRVLTVGQGLNDREFQANILVNVMGKDPHAFAHTFQVGQIFTPEIATREAAVLDRDAARAAARKLLAGWYDKMDRAR